jgi:hypothetical protein
MRAGYRMNYFFKAGIFFFLIFAGTCVHGIENPVWVLNKDSLVYKFDSVGDVGKLINHNDEIKVEFPQEFKNRKLNFVRIYSRKDPSNFCPNEKGWDPNAIYLSVYGLNQKENKWKQWADQFGNEKFVKVSPVGKFSKNVFLACQKYIGDFPIQKMKIKARGTGDLENAIAYIEKIEFIFIKKPALHIKSEMVIKPTRLESQTVFYELDLKKGLPLKHGKSWFFETPEEYSNHLVNYINLVHRKHVDKPVKEGYWDPNPACLLVEVIDKKTGIPYPWYDSFGMEKFSEPKVATDPEYECLHDFIAIMGEVKTAGILITNVGKGDKELAQSHIHSLSVQFLPNLENTLSVERIFTPETKFIDTERGIDVAVYGGGPRYKGKFKNSVLLGAASDIRAMKINNLPREHRFEITENPTGDCYKDGLGRLHIKLPVNKKIKLIEVAVGDVDNTVMKKNKDNHFGRLGSAMINIYFRRKCPVLNQDKWQLLTWQQNVGPVSTVYASGCEARTIHDDEIIIESVKDVSYLMGYRISFSQK